MEPIRQAEVVPIDDPSRVAEARRAVRGACERIDLTEEETGKAELIAVELANNILQHADVPAGGLEGSSMRPVQPGRLLVSSDAWGKSVQIVAIDQGPGIASVQRALEDGYSTRSTPGLGLGAVKRLSRSADIFSTPGNGTVVAVSVGAPIEDTLSGEPMGWCGGDVAVISSAIQGETVSGDSWAVCEAGDRCLYMIVDGLGHGLHASEAAGVATRFLFAAVRQDAHISLTRLLEQMHGAMRGTRGAAIAVISVEQKRRRIICCGIGNVSCLLQPSQGRVQNLVSHNGTIGHQMRRVQEFEYGYDKGTLLIMHSDGLATHWKLDQYPGLAMRSPDLIAGVLYRDALRGRDDATVLVARLE